MKKALVIIDVQAFFLHDAPTNFTKRIKDHINETLYDVCVFTVFRNTSESNFVKSLNWAKCSRKEDVRLPEDLHEFVSHDNVFERATYSGFATTQLDTYLKESAIDELVLCGIDTDACVLATAFSAFDLGYKVRVNFDLTFSSGDLEEQAQAIIRRSIIPQDRSN